jgi:hypothetical protein
MTKDRKSILAALTGGRLASAPTSATAPEAEGAAYIAKSRRGKKALLTHHDPAVLAQLKHLAIEEDTTQQKLIAEALNLLFTKYHKHPIA